MATSFAQLFRHSKFVSAHEKQVISTPKHFKTLNEFGIKHALPSCTHSSLTLESWDDANIHQPRIKSAWRETTAMKIWKENFPPMTPLDIQERAMKAFKDQEISLDSLDSKAFEKLVKTAKERSKEFQQLVKEKKLKADQWDQFLGIKKTSNTQEQPVSVHPPTYSVIESKTPVKVKGRILNRIQGGYAVGIAGYVAFLPDREADFDVLLAQGNKEDAQPFSSSNAMSVDVDSVFEFTVASAKFDSFGRPDITLTLRANRKEKYKLKFPTQFPKRNLKDIVKKLPFSQ